MSGEDNLGTVKSIYEAFGKGDVETILAALTDDVDWASEAASDVAPWWGQRVGKDAVAGFFEAIGGAMNVLEFEPKSFAANDSEVMALVRFRVTFNASGKEVAMDLHHYWRFRDGQVEYYRGSEDTALVAAALQ